MERTLILIKPDAVQRGLAGEILSRLERRGLKIVGLKLISIDDPLARRHYAEHEGKPFLEGLVGFITSSPVIAGVLEGPNAVEAARATMGATDPQKAAPGTIRGDLGLFIQNNLIHGSDSTESAKREIALFFSPDELVSWDRSVDSWIHEG
ncbi:MAG: nucleoside-diphosphate kinase [Dehalococcoidia bacterium]